MGMSKSANGSTNWLLRALVLVLVACAVTLTACGGDDSTESTTTGASGGTDTTATGGDAPAESIKVALLTPGTADDGSWGQANAEGATAGAAEFNAELEIAGNLDTPDQYTQQATSFASAGYDLIIIANGAMGDVTLKLAKQYPDVKWGQIAVPLDPLPENVSSANPLFPIGTFRAGVLAGLMTKTNRVGTIGGFDFPVLTSEMEGFALGARYSNPDVKVTRAYLDSWTDVGKAKAATEAQVSAGADIMFSATNQASQGMYQVLQGKKDHWAIPQYLDLHEQAPDVILTSVLHGLQDVNSRFIEMASTDQWVSENAEMGLDFGTGELAPFFDHESAVPADVKAELDSVTEKIKSGEIVVPTIEELGTSGSGDKIDPKSLNKAT